MVTDEFITDSGFLIETLDLSTIDSSIKEIELSPKDQGKKGQYVKVEFTNSLPGLVITADSETFIIGATGSLILEQPINELKISMESQIYPDENTYGNIVLYYWFPVGESIIVEEEDIFIMSIAGQAVYTIDENTPIELIQFYRISDEDADEAESYKDCIFLIDSDGGIEKVNIVFSEQSEIKYTFEDLEANQIVSIELGEYVGADIVQKKIRSVRYE